ncbi:MAG: hypothetical protein ACYC0V_21515, partial [Armatimonadota bacterium]
MQNFTRSYITPWTSVGTSTSVTRPDLMLRDGWTYFFSVVAKNGVGMWSSEGVSDGITVNALYTDPGQVVLDFLGGIGDFKKSTYVMWYAYSNSIHTDSSTLWPLNNPNSTNGVDEPETNDTVADGWIRTTDANIIPGSNAGNNDIYDLITDGGYKWQLLGIQGLTSGTGTVFIDHHIPVDNTKSWRLHTGDTITLHADRIKMTDYIGLPSGSSVNFRMRISCYNGNYYPYKELTPSPSAFTDQLTCTIPANTTDVAVQFYVLTSGNLSNISPTLYVSGAHLYVERSGENEYEMRSVPVEHNRNIKTHNMFYWEEDLGYYETARDYDEISATMSQYASAIPLKHFNPDLKFYLYESGTYCVAGSSLSDLFCLSPFSFSQVQNNSTMEKWLYYGGHGTNGYVDCGSYTDRFPVNIAYHQGYNDASDYQLQWAEAVIDRARTIGADGVWIDDMSRVIHLDNDGLSDDVNRTPLEILKFQSRVYPMLREAGLTIIQNEGGQHITGPNSGLTYPDGDSARIFLYPGWKPDGTVYTRAAGYRDNSTENTPDIIFQEFAFINHSWTSYGNAQRDYWLACLKDMDEIRVWNASLDEDKKRSIQMWVRCSNSDVVDWLHFGLCSYLLGQSDYSSVGFAIYIDSDHIAVYPDPDQINLAATKTLGVPDGDYRKLNQNNNYFLYRNYKSDGSANSYGGIVVVNGGTTTARFIPTRTVYLEGIGNAYGPNLNNRYMDIAPH